MPNFFPRSSKLFLSVAVVLSLCSTGCLVIGGKTQVCNSSKQAEERVAVLENRIKVLEQYAGITAPPAQESPIQVAGLTQEAPAALPTR